MQGVTLDELAVGIADHEIRLVGEHQRAQVPQVLADMGLGVLAVRGFGTQLVQGLLVALVGVIDQHLGGLGPQLRQELGEP